MPSYSNREMVPETPAYKFMRNIFLKTRATAIARTDILNQLSKDNDVVVYTHEIAMIFFQTLFMAEKIDYYDTMPSVFHNSKINLNITLKTIQTGIPCAHGIFLDVVDFTFQFSTGIMWNISFPEKILFIMNLLMMPQKKAAYFSYSRK